MAILFLFLTGLSNSQAQTPTAFPEENGEFIEAFSAHIGKSKRDESYEAAAVFTETFNNLAPEMKAVVKATAASMLKNRVRNYPVYTLYAQIVNAIVEQQATFSQDHITVLKDLIESARPGAYKQFENYIKYLPDLMEDRVLFKTATKRWIFPETGTYTPGVDDGRPYLEFTSVDITGMTKKDTITVYGTSGRCFPLDKDWIGQGGSYFFSRAGWLESEVSAELSNYKIDMDKADFVFDSVYFSMPAFLDGKVLGTVQEKLYSTVPQTLTYPRFASLSTDLTVKNIDERITTSGGFKLEGQRIIINGTMEQPALITFATGGRKQAEARARRFLIKLEDQEIISENAEIILYMKKDSLFHPALIFVYNMALNELKLQRSEGIASNLPYKSTYHKMDMGFNTVLWNLDSTFIKLETVSSYTSDPVQFTSYDHYVPQGELKYLTLTGRNPLQMIRDLADSYGTMDLHGGDLAGMMGYPLQQIENVLYKLTKDGFIYYDPKSKRMTVDYKTFHYMDAGTGEFDYDHLLFRSDPKGSNLNGVISIDSQVVIIKGVQTFDLSKLKRVTLTPGESDVTLTADRDLEMEGKLSAGKLDFKGKGMHFDYDGFKVEMRSVDTLQIYVKGKELDQFGEYPDVPLRSVISDVKGSLYVDDPGNKSGLADYPEYPYFESYDTAYVFFDDNYDSTKFPREQFYFAIYPFTLDSISKTITDSLAFYGQFVSGDIFNPFETFISVQKDLTLGIDEISPAGGLAIYKDAGQFFGNYKLREKGLLGDGRITYRKSELRSAMFDFNTDSLYAKLDTFFMVADAASDVPQSQIGRSFGYWWPYEDSMLVMKDRRNFQMYDGALSYSGNLIYHNGSLYGISDTVELARHRLDQGRLYSRTTEFGKDIFQAGNANLEIFMEGSEKPVVNVSGVDAEINMATAQGAMTTVSDTIITTIRNNQLITDFREIKWDIEGEKVTFRNNETLDHFFTSTYPAYDSLKFNAASATYDIIENKTTADGVTDITVADSKLIPPGQRLIIQQGGTIEPMSNATLVLNREGEYHTINNADLLIRSKNDFSGTGSYFYETATGDPYTISIDEITVREDTTGTGGKKKGEEEEVSYFVQARGVIPEEDFFRLDEQFFYKGNAYIYSNDKDIKFDGYGKLDLKQNEASSWFNLNQGIDPGNFSLAIDSLINETRQNVVAGLFVSPGELEVYSAIMNPKRSSKDPALFQVKGSLFKGENSGEYVFGQEAAVNGEDAAGTIMRYNDNTGVIDIDGAISWVSGIPMVSVAGFGNLTYDPRTKATKATSSIAIDFPMDESIWYQLPRDIVEYQDNIKMLDYDRPEIKRMLRYFIPDENDAEVIIGDIEAEGYFQLPADFPYKMLLTDVELNWDPVDGNFKSTNTIGISAINKYPIDLRVKAYTEFGYSLGTNYMNLYFETSSGEWYFFSTKRGKMYVLSSDQSFNDIVVNSDNKEVRASKKGEVLYEFQPGNLTSKLTFMQRFDDYLLRTGGTRD
jgi:hypothetical protein